MNTSFLLDRYNLIVSATFLAALACGRKPPEPSLDPMLAAPTCDTTPMKAVGRAVEIPETYPRATFGVVTGAVVQAETGDAIQDALVQLAPIDAVRGAERVWHYSNPKGGFSFDSLQPATYRLSVRRLGEMPSIDTVRPSAGRIDTLTLRMRAYRCYGY